MQDGILEQSTIEYKNDVLSMDTVHIENRERQQVWKDDSLIRVLAALVGDPGLVSNANVMTYQHSQFSSMDSNAHLMDTHCAYVQTKHSCTK